MRREHGRDELVIASWPISDHVTRPLRKRRSPGQRAPPSRLRMRHDRAEESLA